MSEGMENVVMFVIPARVTVCITMLVGGLSGIARSTSFVLSVIFAGVLSLVVGFFVTFTTAWAVTNSEVAIWLAAIGAGVVVAVGALVSVIAGSSRKSNG